MKSTRWILLCMACILVVVSVSSVNAWWDKSNRFPINCTGITTGVPVIINGSNGFQLPGDTARQLVWTQCSPSIYLYWESYNNYAVGNNESARVYDVEQGNASSLNASQVWSTDFVSVYHGADLTDAAARNNLKTYGTVTNQANSTKCMVGKCFHFLNAASTLSNASTVTGFTSGATNISFVTWGYRSTNALEAYACLFGVGKNAAGYAYQIYGESGVMMAGVAGGTAFNTGVNGQYLNIYAFRTSSGTIYFTKNLTTNSSSSIANVAIGAPYVIIIATAWNTYGANGWANGDADATLDEVRIANRYIPTSELEQYQLNIWGASGYGTLDASEVVPNQAPNTSMPSITPSPAHSDDELNCSTTPTDAENTTLDVDFAWAVNGIYDGMPYNITIYGVQNNTLTYTTMLVSEQLFVGENWTCSVRASDGTTWSGWKNTTIQIQNTPLTWIQTPSNITVSYNQNLSYDLNATDIDPTTIIKYYTNSTKFSANISTGLISYTFNDSDTGNWSVVANATDQMGGWINATFNIEILNVTPNPAPIVTAVTILPAAPTTANDLNCWATITDDNETNLTAEYYWYNDTVLYSSGNTSDMVNGTSTLVNTLNHGVLIESDLWNCTVFARDTLGTRSLSGKSATKSIAAATTGAASNYQYLALVLLYLGIIYLLVTIGLELDASHYGLKLLFICLGVGLLVPVTNLGILISTTLSLDSGIITMMRTLYVVMIWAFIITIAYFMIYTAQSIFGLTFDLTKLKNPFRDKRNI